MKFNQKTLALASGLAVMTAVVSPVLAQTTAEMLKTAEAACIEHAAKDGYDPNRAEVISSRALDADKVEVVLNLTKDGQNFARLTCPYSASTGIGSLVGDAMGSVGQAVDTVATPAPGLGRLWWLLVPLIGLPLLLWALRGRDKDYVTSLDRTVADRVYTEGYVNTTGGPLDVHEYPNMTSRVVRSLTNGEHVRLTGRHDNNWVEVTGGGWVPSASLRYSDDISRR